MTGKRKRLIEAVPAVVLAAAILTLYLTTLAQGLVLGDPSEYTFVAHTLSIAHPPGYAFITLLGHLYQRLIPFGTFPWRMHLLAATGGTVIALSVFGAIRAVDADSRFSRPSATVMAASFAALTAATAVNLWQHAIHANPHILTAAFLAANLFFLTRWWASDAQNHRWLLAFCLSAGLGVTHHPLTVFAWPAYALFILWSRPSLLREGRNLLTMVAVTLLGLLPWLYFPLRSPQRPPFGPANMGSLAGFLDVVLARGLRGNLFAFGLADQADRALVFGTLLRLQYALPTLALALIGLGWLALDMRGRSRRPLLLLYGGALLLNYTFIINTVQDVMAYLIGPFLLVALLAGVGLLGLLHLAHRRLGLTRLPLTLLTAALFLLGPIAQIATNVDRVSLRDYNEGDAYVTAVFDFFDGQNERAVLLNDWEHMTPLWYTRFVAERWPDPSDVRPEFVSAARPWLSSVFDYLGGGPVYLSNYRHDIFEAGFRLRPRGPFYQVVEPGDASIPPELTSRRATYGPLELVAYDLPLTAVAGDFIPFTLAMRTPIGTADFYTPLLLVGDLRFPFTTDRHLVTPDWQPGETIVERFDFALPHDLAAGAYPVSLLWHNLSRDEISADPISLGDLTVAARPNPPRTDRLVANFRQRAGLAAATAVNNNDRRRAPWSDPFLAAPGDTIDLTLQWRVLAPAEESYTVFVHLIDLGNQLVAPALDYTPLGGATPTHLWIPKWLPGQQMIDPYHLTLPADLPPGRYLVEVGLYEMISGRRLYLHDAAGNHAGDRFILGPISVVPR